MYSFFNIEQNNPVILGRQEAASRKNFFSQMISSYSSIVFLNQGKYIACRDYLTLKIWDVAKTDLPLVTIPIQTGLKSRLC